MRFKWILGVVAAVIIVLIVAVYLILVSYDYNKLKPRIAEAARDATGRELVLKGDIALEIGLTPSLVVEDVSFQNAPWGSRPEMATIKRFEVQVALLPLLGGTVEVKRFILVEPEILIETDKSGRTNLVFEAPEKAVTPEPSPEPLKIEPADEGITLPALTLEELRIERGVLTYRDGRSKKSYSVKLESLTAKAASVSSPLKLKLKGEYNEEPFELAGTLGPLPAFIDPDKAWPLDLKIRALGIDLALDGTVKDPLAPRGINLAFTATVDDPAGLAPGRELPLEGPLPPLAVSGRLKDTAPESFNVSELKLALGGMSLNGSVDINLAKDPLGLKVALNSQRLDLRPLVPEGGEGDGTAKPAAREKVFPADPLPLVALAGADAALKFQAGQVLLPRLALNDLEIDLTVKNGRLTVKPIKATVGGGAMDGGLELKPAGKATVVAVEVKVDRLDLGLMLKDLEVTEALEGRVDVDVDVRGRGGSVAELMAGLNGNTSVVMGKGMIDNKYLAFLGKDLSSGVFRLINPGADEKDRTEINCMVARLDINEGMAKSTALVLDTTTMSVVGEGVINLKTEGLDLSLKPVPKKEVIPVGLNLGELAKPFRLGGTLAKPSLKIDPAETALAIGKAIGGMTLFGPVGIASALVSKGSGDENPCLAAVEAAKKGTVTEGGKPAEEKGTVDKTTEDLKKGIEDLGEGLKKLFGK